METDVKLKYQKGIDELIWGFEKYINNLIKNENIQENTEIESLIHIDDQNVNQLSPQAIESNVKLQMYSILKEFIQSVDTSIQLMELERFSLAFDLIRKPANDHIDVMEFLIADPDYFIKNLLLENIRKVDVSRNNVREEVREKLLSNEAVQNMGLDRNRYTFYYNYRYQDSSSNLTLKRVMNKANHIISNSTINNEQLILNTFFFDESKKEELENVFYNSSLAFCLYLNILLRITIEKFNFSNEQEINKELIDSYKNAKENIENIL